MAKPKSRWEDVVLVISRAMIYNIEFEGVTFLKSGEAVAVLYLVMMELKVLYKGIICIDSCATTE